MEKPIRVRILGREFALRVAEEHEQTTREIAALVDERMQAFKDAHPEQPEMTAAIITALALAEENRVLQDEHAQRCAELEAQLDRWSDRLGQALPEPSAPTQS